MDKEKKLFEDELNQVLNNELDIVDWFTSLLTIPKEQFNEELAPYLDDINENDLCAKGMKVNK